MFLRLHFLFLIIDPKLLRLVINVHYHELNYLTSIMKNIQRKYEYVTSFVNQPSQQI